MNPANAKPGSKAYCQSVTPLPRSFYTRPVLRVAEECIGKILVHESAMGRVGGAIVESEAYSGPLDRAANSYGGRRTKRTEVMFGPPGYADAEWRGLCWCLGKRTLALLRPVQSVGVPRSQLSIRS